MPASFCESPASFRTVFSSSRKCLLSCLYIRYIRSPVIGYVNSEQRKMNTLPAYSQPGCHIRHCHTCRHSGRRDPPASQVNVHEQVLDSKATKYLQVLVLQVNVQAVFVMRANKNRSQSLTLKKGYYPIFFCVSLHF